MKKHFILLLITAALIASFIPASAGTEAVTVSGTIYLDDSITVPEGGLPVTLYIGNRRGSSSLSPALPYAEWEYPRNGIGYKGTSVSVPSAYGNRERISKKIRIEEEKTFVIPYGSNSVDYSIDTDAISYGKTFGIAYEIDTDDCAGYDWDYTDSLENDIYVESIHKKVSVSGQITVPAHENELKYTVIAEANRVLDIDDKNRSYRVSNRSYVFKSEGTIAANETKADYDLKVIADNKYFVYIIFDGKEYVRQEKEFENLKNDVTLNFGNFEESKEYSGIIKLPEDTTAFIDPDGTELDTVTGTLTLQSATSPYYYLDSLDFEINKGETSAEFAFKDDMGAGDAILYFSLKNQLKDIYGLGNYKSNTETVPLVSDAGKLSSSRDDIVVCIPKGKTVCPVVDYENDDVYRSFVYVYVIPQSGEETLDYNNAENIIECFKLDKKETEDGRLIITCCATIPQNCGYTIATTPQYDDDELYADDTKFMEFSESAKRFAADENPYILLGEYPYTSALVPYYDYSFFCEEDEEDENSYCIGCEFRNRYEKDHDNVIAFFVFYDENGKILSCSSKKYSISGNDYGFVPYISVPIELVDKAKYMELFVWADGISPIAKTQCLDDFTLTSSYNYEDDYEDDEDDYEDDDFEY